MSSNGTNRFEAIDSLVANEFALEVDGKRVNGIFRISGLTTFKMAYGSNQIVNQPFKIAKMVQRDGSNPVNNWIRETRASNESADRPRRTLTILAIDDGVVIRRWTAQGAWISEISYSDFNSASAEMVEETLTIYYNQLDEEWPATS
ncbi:MAG: phage tail protein [Anaerolineae bacterium]